jgi:SAM-dependent methyltransferase
MCGARYYPVEEIWRMLTEQQRAQYAPFLESYPALRAREGWERDDAYFLRLPDVDKRDPTAPIWRIRRRSLRVLEGVLQREIGTPQGQWALDLGAGNGWLSRRLSKRGFETVALDLNTAGSDSLAGGRLLMEQDGVLFHRVQASMDNLPFADDVFALCTVSSAIYYANLEDTLHSVYRVLQPGGLLAITDSPVYSHEAAGLRMAKEQQTRIAHVLGREPSALPGGQGFLVESRLLAQMREIGFLVRIVPIQNPLGRAKRLALRLLRPRRREEARFPVILGVKPKV